MNFLKIGDNIDKTDEHKSWVYEIDSHASYELRAENLWSGILGLWHWKCRHTGFMDLDMVSLVLMDSGQADIMGLWTLDMQTCTSRVGLPWDIMSTISIIHIPTCHSG